MRRRRSRSMRSRRPISPGWRGSAPRSVRTPRRPARFICARPTPSRKRICCRKPRSRQRHDARGRFCPNCGAAARRRSSPRPCAMRQGSPQLHGASFHRGWGEGEFETMLTERNTLVHRLRIGRKTIGFAVSRMAADEAEILSIAVDAEPSRPRPVARPAADASRPSRRPRRAHGIPRSRGK